MRSYHTVLKDFDKQTSMLCRRLATQVLEPDQRVKLAQQILMLQEDRRNAVQEILARARFK